MKLITACLTLTVLTFIALACSPSVPPEDEQLQTGQLVFRADVGQDATEDFVINLKVANTGLRKTAAQPGANAVMELRDEHDILQASSHISSLSAIDPEATLDTAEWRGRLDPGTYRVLWGASGLSYSVVEFVIFEQNGRPILGEQRIMAYPNLPMPDLPTFGEAQPLVDRAIAQLSDTLDVETDAIAVQRVSPREFADTSLGVPEPDQLYAQVITPGYVIELSYEDLSYIFHGAGDQLVFIPHE